MHDHSNDERIFAAQILLIGKSRLCQKVYFLRLTLVKKNRPNGERIK